MTTYQDDRYGRDIKSGYSQKAWYASKDNFGRRPTPYHRCVLTERGNTILPNPLGLPVGSPNYGRLFFYDILRANIPKGVTTSVHNNALGRVNDELTVYDNLFEAWYERKEAISMAVNAANKMLAFVTGWRKPSYWKHLAKNAKRPESLPEAWITYQFGIKPLVGTYDSVLKMIASELPPIHVIGRSSSAFVTKNVLDGAPSIYGRGTYSKKIGCSVIPNQNPLSAMSNIVGLRSPFSTAWSVIPWGWAIDYFVNISQMLTNVEDTHPGLICKDWYEGVTCRMKWFGHEEAIRYPYNSKTGNYEETKTIWCYYDGEGYEFTRSLTGQPSYKLEFSVPELGTNQFANLMSAIALTMKGK